MKTNLTFYSLKTVLILLCYFLFIIDAFSQDLFFPYRIGTSDVNNSNVNHPDGTKLQDLKRSSGVFLTNNLSGCSCTLVNAATQKGIAYVSIAEHCVSKYDVGKWLIGYFSFDFEMPHALERDNINDNQSISGIYKVEYEILFKDEISDLALLGIKKYDPQLLQYAYASGWNNTIGSGDDIWSNISHPKIDHKKIFINPNSIDFNWEKIDVEGNSLYGYFYTSNSPWNNKNTDLEIGSSGSGFFSEQNLLKAVHVAGTKGSNSIFSIISNKWYGAPTESYFAKYLDSNNSWLNNIPGGYINDLVPIRNDEAFDLALSPNEILNTTSFNVADPKTLHKDVLWLNPKPLFGFVDDKDSNSLPIWFHIKGIKADNVRSSDIVLSVYYLDKDPQSESYIERLLYGAHVNSKSTINYPEEFGFKGDSWDCDNPPAGYPPCNRIHKDAFSSENESTNIKYEYIKDMIELSDGKFKSVLKDKIPIRVRLDNIGSDIVKVQAISYPGDVPKNALQLFKPDEVWAKFKSYKYPESRRENSEDLYIDSLQVSQGDYSKSIPTGNNGGYLNLVNPNFKIGPIKTSTISELNKTLSFNIAVHNPNSVAYSYSIWIDYFNKEVSGGKNDVNYTYNFVHDPVSHPIELIKQGTGITGNKISFTSRMPTGDDILLPTDSSRQTRMRISIKEGNTPPNQNDTTGNGEVEDYLIELFSTSKSIFSIIASKAKIYLKGNSALKDVTFPSTCPSSAPNDAPVSAPSTTQVWDVNPPYTCNTFQGSCNAAGTCSSLVEDNDTAEGSYAINFIGTDDIVTIDNGDLLIHNAFEERTVSLWIKKENITPNKLEVIYDEGGDSDGFAIRLNGSKVELSVLIENQLQTITSTNDIPTNQWVNLTGVFNHGEIALYLDGVKQATDNYFKNNGKTIVPIHSDNAGWGGTNSTNVWNTSLNHFEGKSDDLLIYDQALSLGEITALSTPEISPSAKTASTKTDIKDNEPLFTIYPNPVKNYLNILVGTTQSGQLHLEITDLNGKKVYEMNRANVEKGDHLIELKNLNLPASIYILSLKVGDVTRNEKIVVE